MNEIRKLPDGELAVMQAVSPKKVWRGDWIVGLSAGLLMLAAANIGIIVT